MVNQDGQVIIIKKLNIFLNYFSKKFVQKRLDNTPQQNYVYKQINIIIIIIIN